MTLHELLSQTKETLRNAGVESFDADARILMQYALGMTREELFMNSSEVVGDFQAGHLQALIARRLKHEPVSRITGLRSFWKSDFKITEETLDPRADSEVLIEAVLKASPRACPGVQKAVRPSYDSKDARTRFWTPGQARGDDAFSIIDLGTGSGCLLLSLLQEFPEATGLGLDISEGAVKTARENAATLGLAARASFKAGNWNEMAWDRPFDIVISNPPYITEDEMKTLSPDVALFDPLRALYGGLDGLDCYRDIIGLLPRLLKPAGLVVFEVGYRQAGAVKDLLEQAGFPVLEITTDLAGHDRCVAARGV